MTKPTTGRISNQELVGKDIFAMSFKELKKHTADLLDERRRLKTSVVPSVTECDNLLGLSQAELNSRSSARLAKVALLISLLSILASAGLSIFA